MNPGEACPVCGGELRRPRFAGGRDDDDFGAAIVAGASHEDLADRLVGIGA